MKTNELKGDFSNSNIGDIIYWIETRSICIGYGTYTDFPRKVGTSKIIKLSPKRNVIEFENVPDTSHIYTSDIAFNIALDSLEDNIDSIIKKIVQRLLKGEFTYHLSRLDADAHDIEDELYVVIIKRLKWLSDLHL